MQGSISTGPGSVPTRPPANDASHSPPEDILDQLRRDHRTVLAELDCLFREHDAAACEERLRRLRTAWVVHALAEEAVVYRALENAASAERADERFIEHELVGGLFEKLAAARPGTYEWNARLKVIGDLMRRHIDSEEGEVFARLERHFDAGGLAELGANFRLAHEKLSLLERAKAS